MTDSRKLECLAYLTENAPTQEILDRFSESLDGWNVQWPLYCEKTDTISGLHQLAFTLAIAHDFSDQPMGGFSERYCFEDPMLAVEELIEWHKRSFDDQRPKGWVACRNVSSKSIKKSFEKHHSEDYAKELLKYAGGNGIDNGAHHIIMGNKARIKAELGYDDNHIKHLAAYLKEVGLIY
ncbi:hypothetical protein KW882_02180 [Vibrio parahaemolyticus]